MDLSKLLGDLYQTDETDSPDAMPAASSSQPAAAPEWANEARLDEAFASWKPGPPDDAPAAERELADGYQGTSFPQLETPYDHGSQDDGPNRHHSGLPGPELPELSGHGLNGDSVDEQGDEQMAVMDQSPTDGGVADAIQADQVDGDGDDPVTAPSPMWTRADDDVLPHRRGRRRDRRLSLRRR